MYGKANNMALEQGLLTNMFGLMLRFAPSAPHCRHLLCPIAVNGNYIVPVSGYNN